MRSVSKRGVPAGCGRPPGCRRAASLVGTSLDLSVARDRGQELAHGGAGRRPRGRQRVDEEPDHRPRSALEHSVAPADRCVEPKRTSSSPVRRDKTSDHAAWTSVPIVCRSAEPRRVPPAPGADRCEPRSARSLRAAAVSPRARRRATGSARSCPRGASRNESDRRGRRSAGASGCNHDSGLGGGGSSHGRPFRSAP